MQAAASTLHKFVDLSYPGLCPHLGHHMLDLDNNSMELDLPFDFVLKSVMSNQAMRRLVDNNPFHMLPDLSKIV